MRPAEGCVVASLLSLCRRHQLKQRCFPLRTTDPRLNVHSSCARGELGRRWSGRFSRSGGSFRRLDCHSPSLRPSQGPPLPCRVSRSVSVFTKDRGKACRKRRKGRGDRGQCLPSASLSGLCTLLRCTPPKLAIPPRPTIMPPSARTCRPRCCLRRLAPPMLPDRDEQTADAARRATASLRPAPGRTPVALPPGLAHRHSAAGIPPLLRRLYRLQQHRLYRLRHRTPPAGHPRARRQGAAQG